MNMTASQIFPDPIQSLHTPTQLRSGIINYARTFLNTPFRHQGRTKYGLDCVGLVIRVGNDLNLFEYDVTAYSPRTNGHEFMHYFRDAGLREVAWEERKPGDIILMHDRCFPCHLALLTKRDPDSVIHAFASRRKVVEERFTPDLRARLVGVFSFVI